MIPRVSFETAILDMLFPLFHCARAIGTTVAPPCPMAPANIIFGASRLSLKRCRKKRCAPSIPRTTRALFHRSGAASFVRIQAVASSCHIGSAVPIGPWQRREISRQDVAWVRLFGKPPMKMDFEIGLSTNRLLTSAGIRNNIRWHKEQIAGGFQGGCLTYE